jgi:quercetin 2,3-dioxygenase
MIMERVIHKAEDRGHSDHGWLKSAHSFSFSEFYNKEKMHFGKLRVLNDDFVAPGKGFGMHPHQDMEIITIPISGALKHSDNMGNETLLTSGEVQVMSAGTGITHSEFNASISEPVEFFQIWIFTDQTGHKPRYGQKHFDFSGRKEKWQLLVSFDGKFESLKIHQNAYISILESGHLERISYSLNSPGNGVYFMVIEGIAEAEGTLLEKRDAAGFWAFSEALLIDFSQPSTLLAIEIPVH